LRWKLLIAASLLAAVAGVAAVYVAALFLPPPSPPDWAVRLTLLAPLAAITFASIFVYRHTPRRRGLQAVLTVLFASLLTFLAYMALAALLPRGL
jgi:hypothetical protein